MGTGTPASSNWRNGVNVNRPTLYSSLSIGLPLDAPGRLTDPVQAPCHACSAGYQEFFRKKRHARDKMCPGPQIAAFGISPACDPWVQYGKRAARSSKRLSEFVTRIGRILILPFGIPEKPAMIACVVWTLIYCDNGRRFPRLALIP
jgi:hypothetical protein